jgi:putative hydrolase of the HAD superfamily
VTATAVVFDLDDTLYLERDYVRSGFSAVGAYLFTEHGVEGFVELAWDLFEDGVRGDTFDRALVLLDRTDLTPIIPDLVLRYRSHEPTIAPTADAKSALARLRGKHRIGVITDGPLDSQRAKAKALGVSEWADHVVFTADLGTDQSKPHPASFELMEQHLPTDRYAYVADNPQKDFTAPHDRGWTTVRVRRPLSLHVDAPSGTDVDIEVADLSRLDDWLD